MTTAVRPGESAAGSWRNESWLEQTIAFVLAGAGVGALASATGGYLSLNEAWAALVAFALAAIGLLLRESFAFTRLQIALVVLVAAFAAWVALSAIWTHSTTSTVYEVQRDLAYLGLIAAATVYINRRTSRHALGGALFGAAAVCSYALGVRLYPDVFGGFDSTAYSYRLATPVTYWNGLGVFAAVTLLLAFAFAARGRRWYVRVGAGALVPLVFATMYFTFSRGAWAALAVGLVVALLIGPARLQLAATLLVLAPWPTLVVLATSHRPALTTIGAAMGPATRQGHALGQLLIILSVAAALSAGALAWLEIRLALPGWVSTAVGTVIALACIGACVVVWSQAGSPWSLATRAWHSFEKPPVATGPELQNRLLHGSSSYRVDLWRVSLHSAGKSPLLGSGAGTFWESWSRYRTVPLPSAEGHSLYLETLGELGVVGLALLGSALAVPLFAVGAGRRGRLAGPLAGGYVAWLVHAGVDWDWELVGVSLLPLLAGVALIAEAPSAVVRSNRIRNVAVAASVALAVAAFIGLMGNVHSTRAVSDLRKGKYVAATRQASAAAKWAPWSSRPAELKGIAYSLLHDDRRAEVAFQAAVAKDPRSWILWSELASVSTGRTRTKALRAAAALNPLTPGMPAGGTP